MPVITVKNTGKSFSASPAVSLLNSLLREGIRINHFCGGKAACGTCRITVLSGSENLSPPGNSEKKRLEAVKAKADQRLACQSYLYDDILIEIPGLKQ